MTRSPDQIANDLIAKIDGKDRFVPKVGIHRGIPMAEYLALDACSNSRLNDLRRSPAHCRESILYPPEPTLAMKVGTAIHTAILEPDAFALAYAGAEGDKKTKGVMIRDLAPAVSQSVWQHKAAAALLENGESELSLVWVDEDTGLLCKGRIDHISLGFAGGTILDVKSTTDASRDAFERSIFKYGYHRQGAHYLEACRVLDLPVRHYSILAAEKDSPYCCAVYRLDEGAIDAGNEQLRPLLKRYAECVATGEWPGYPIEIQDIALPDYAWKQISDETETS